MVKKGCCALTTLEEELMELFWAIDEPLTSIDIPGIAVGHTWNDSYLQILLRSLLNKEMIKIYGFVQCGRQYVRQFISAITKEEYIAKFIMSKELGINMEAKVVLEILKVISEKGKVQEYIIEQMEEMLRKIKTKEL